jgi:hypothetical protein
LPRAPGGYASVVEIQVAREVDLDRVLEALRERGHDPEVEELGIRVRCEDEVELCDGLLSDLETWLAESGVPLVPEQANGHVYLRPPGS